MSWLCFDPTILIVEFGAIQVLVQISGTQRLHPAHSTGFIGSRTCALWLDVGDRGPATGTPREEDAKLYSYLSSARHQRGIKWSLKSRHWMSCLTLDQRNSRHPSPVAQWYHRSWFVKILLSSVLCTLSRDMFAPLHPPSSLGTRRR